MPADDGVTVSEMLERYRLHCESFYRHPNGEPTGEAGTIGLCCRPLRELYSDRPANEFGPLDLQAVRSDMIANRKLSRSFINAAVRKIVRAFRWAASQQLIPVSVVDALRTVDGLKAGQTEARESRPVVAVSDVAFSATLPHLPPIIRDMALIGRLTGCRPGEICAMRPADIDRSRPVWVYSPRLHKNSWRGKDRRVFIAADAQAILETYLNRAPDSYCFSPGESIGRMRADRRANRKTRESCGNKPGSNKKAQPKRKPAERYTTRAYSLAIRRAAVKAGIEVWNANKLRHAAARDVQAAFGLEATAATLGNTVDVARLYAGANHQLAERVAIEMAQRRQSQSPTEPAA